MIGWCKIPRHVRVSAWQWPGRSFPPQQLSTKVFASFPCVVMVHGECRGLAIVVALTSESSLQSGCSVA